MAGGGHLGHRPLVKQRREEECPAGAYSGDTVLAVTKFSSTQKIKETP